jgi:hypothetical protein
MKLFVYTALALLGTVADGWDMGDISNHCAQDPSTPSGFRIDGVGADNARLPQLEMVDNMWYAAQSQSVECKTCDRGHYYKLPFYELNWPNNDYTAIPTVTLGDEDYEDDDDAEGILDFACTRCPNAANVEEFHYAEKDNMNSFVVHTRLDYPVMTPNSFDVAALEMESQHAMCQIKRCEPGHFGKGHTLITMDKVQLVEGLLTMNLSSDVWHQLLDFDIGAPQLSTCSACPNGDGVSAWKPPSEYPNNVAAPNDIRRLSANAIDGFVYSFINKIDCRIASCHPGYRLEKRVQLVDEAPNPAMDFQMINRNGDYGFTTRTAQLRFDFCFSVDSSSNSSKDEGKYIVLFVGVFFVLAAIVAGALKACNCCCFAGAARDDDSALPTKEPKTASVEMTTA